MFTNSNTRSFMQGMNMNEHKRRRESERYSLRKKSREQLFTAKRRRLFEEETETKISQDEYFDLDSEVTRIAYHVRALSSNDPSCRYNSIQILRKISSVERDPPYEQILAEGAIEPAVRILVDKDHPRLQVEAAWFFTNVAGGPDNIGRVLVENGVLQHFIQVARDVDPTVNIELAGQCAWTIGNFAGNGDHQLRIQCLREETFRLIGELLFLPSGEESSSEMREAIVNGSWCLSNLSRWGTIWLPKSSVQTMTSLIRLGLDRHRTDEIVSNLLWAANTLCQLPHVEYENDDDEKEHFPDPNLTTLHDLLSFGYDILMPELVNCLTVNGKFMHITVRTVGNFLVSDDDITKSIVGLGLLPRLRDLLFNLPHGKSLTEVLWVIHNTMVSLDEPRELADDGVVAKLIVLVCDSPSPSVRREASFCLGYLIDQGDCQDIAWLMKQNVWSAVGRMMSPDNSEDLLDLGLDSASSILEAGQELKEERKMDENPFTLVLEARGCLDLLEDIQASDRVSEEIFNQCGDLIREFWEVEEVEVEDLPQMSSSVARGPGKGFKMSLADCVRMHSFEARENGSDEEDRGFDFEIPVVRSKSSR